MPYTVEVDTNARRVEVVFAGHMGLAEHMSAREEAIRQLIATGFDRLLVDARELDAEMSAVDDFEFTAEHQSTPLASVRMAVLHRSEEEERFRFIENVSVNRGGNMRVFTDAERARDWLAAEDEQGTD